MNIALVAPHDAGCTSNAGAHMITAGIRWLARRAVPEARFINVEMLRDDERQWRAAQTCDALILCGNPRFSLSADAWWEAGIWERVWQAAEKGVRVIDGWAGACLPLPEDPESLGEISYSNTRRLLDMPRMAVVAKAMDESVHAAVTRDAQARECYAQLGIGSQLLPCSSWWAARDLSVLGLSPGVRHPDIIVLLALPDHSDWLPDALRALAQRLAGRLNLPVPFIATTWADYEWALAVGLPDVQLVTDPADLLRLYGMTSRVHSFRVHASIPAASLGCSVLTFAVDTRAQVCAPFNLPVLPFTDLRNLDTPLRLSPQPATEPASQPVIDTLRRMLTSC